MKSNKITDEAIINAAYSSPNMAEAAAQLKLHFNTFKRRAKLLNVYKANQGNKGVSKPKAEGRGKISLEEILSGLHPQYQTFKLKLRLFECGLKNNKCDECKLDHWNGKTIQCELDHIDGDRTNHRLENLRILCPNCHSQTDTFRAKNK